MANPATEKSPVSPVNGEEPKREKFKPNKVLPTDRIAYPKQLDILRTYAAVHTSTQKVVTNTEVADVMKMNVSTVSLANPFFSNVGLLAKVEGGYLPNPDVINFFRADQWDKEKATHKLAPALRDQWFAQAILPKLFLRPMTEGEAIDSLAEASMAGLNYKPQLRVLLNYLESAGLIARDGDKITAGKAINVSAASSMRQAETPTSIPKREPQTPDATVHTDFSQNPLGKVKFNVSIEVDMKEFGEWQSDNIAAFFKGIADVLAAKGRVENLK